MGARIFLAEDHSLWRDLLIDFLKNNGHDVLLVASDLEEARQKAEIAEQVGIDIAILNYSLGNDLVDGIGIAKILYKKAPNVKIIFWTVGKDLGWGDAYVLKGEPDELLAVINKLLVLATK